MLFSFGNMMRAMSKISVFIKMTLKTSLPELGYFSLSILYHKTGPN